MGVTCCYTNRMYAMYSTCMHVCMQRSSDSPRGYQGLVLYRSLQPAGKRREEEGRGGEEEGRGREEEGRGGEGRRKSR